MLETYLLQDSEDVRLMVGALKDLGVKLEEDWANHEITVHGCEGKFPTADAKLNLGNAGTAMRYKEASYIAFQPFMVGLFSIPDAVQSTSN